MNKIQKLTQAIRDNAECQLDYGTIRTLKMIDDESESMTHDAVLGEGWRDARKEFPVEGKSVIVYTDVGSITGGCVYKDVNGIMKFQTDLIDYEYGTDQEVVAWRILVKPAFA